MHKTREILDRLIALQELDARMDVLLRERDRIPEEIRRLEEEKARLQRELEALQERKAELEREIRRLEGEIQSLNAQIEEEKKKARRARTPRELEAVQKEIQYLSRLIREKEERVLELMEALEGNAERGIEGVLVALQLMEERVNARLPEINARMALLEEDLRKVQESLLDFQEERERQIYFIEVDWLELYDRIRRRQGLPVLVELVEGACGACGNVLSEDRLMELEEEGMVQCELCARLIYAPEYLS